MAHPFMYPKFTWTFQASEDLSDEQWHLVKLGTTEGQVSKMAASTDRPIGILMNKPKSGEDAAVMIQGIAYVEAGEELDYGDFIRPDDDGKVLVHDYGTDTGNYVVGTVLVESAATSTSGTVTTNRFGAATIDCLNPPRA